MKYKIQVINAEEVSGTGKNGPYKFQKLHCVIEQPDADPIIGVLIPPKGMDDVKKGKYEAEFGLVVDREQRITGGLKTLTPTTDFARTTPTQTKSV